MKRTIKLDKPIDTVEEVFCNKCGLSLRSPGPGNSLGENYGLIEAEVSGGYFSTHLRDGDVHKFSLCERCLSEMFESFFYSSYQGNFMFPDDENEAEGFDRNQYSGEDNRFLTVEELAELARTRNLDPIADLIFSLDGELVDGHDVDLETGIVSPATKPNKEDMN